MTPGLSSRKEEGDEEGAGTFNFKEDFLEVPQNTADYISGARSLYIAVFSVRETKKCLITGQQSGTIKNWSAVPRGNGESSG